MNYLFRDGADVERLLALLHGRGVRVVAAEDVDISAEVLIAIQEVERARAGERLAAGRAAKRAIAGFGGGSVRYGYRRNGDELAPDEREQEAIRIAAELAGKHSLRGICERLNYLGVHPRNGTKWHPMQVRRMLQQVEAGNVAR